MVLVIGGGQYGGVELNVRAQVEAVRHMIGVVQDLWLGGVFLGPDPLLFKFGTETERVLHAFHVAARTGITVPVPSAADVCGLVQNPDIESGTTQAMKQVKTGEPRSDDKNVDVLSPGAGAVLR